MAHNWIVGPQAQRRWTAGTVPPSIQACDQTPEPLLGSPPFSRAKFPRGREMSGTEAMFVTASAAEGRALHATCVLPRPKAGTGAKVRVVLWCPHRVRRGSDRWSRKTTSVRRRIVWGDCCKEVGEGGSVADEYRHLTVSNSSGFQSRTVLAD